MVALTLSTFSTGVFAQSNVEINGLFDMSIGRFQEAGTRAANRIENGKMSTSYIGFKGSEDLGGGFKAVFALESFVQLDTGASGRYMGPTTTDAFWSRAANVGIASDYGTVRIGRQSTPMFFSTLLFNAFGSSTGLSPPIRQIFNPTRGAALPFFGDTGWNNAIGYASKRYSGFAVNLMANLGEAGTGSYGNNIGGNVIYFGKPFAATLAFNSVKNGATAAPAGFQAQESYQAGASYDFSVVKVYGQYTKVKTRATLMTSTNAYSTGLSVPVGNGNVLAQYGNATSEFGTRDAVNRTFTVAYVYDLSKRTNLYLVGMSDRFTGKTDGNTFATGIRTSF